MAIGKGKAKYATPKMMKYRLPHCGVCEYFEKGFCVEKTVVADAKAGNSDAKYDKRTGLALVDARGCCNEFEPA